jgi:predicted O-methyltransferase YrrM
MEFIDPNIEAYAEAHTTSESAPLQKLNRDTQAKILMPRMLSGHLQGRVLSFISKIHQPKLILEIGTYTGYSAVCLAEGLAEGGQLHTIDINEELMPFTQEHLKANGVEDVVTLHIGDATQIVGDLNEKWDLVFIDADKSNYSNYYDMVMPHMNPGGLIIADNVLWSGKVLEKVESKDIDTAELIVFNQKVHEDDRVENVLLPIRDGLMVVRVK